MKVLSSLIVLILLACTTPSPQEDSPPVDKVSFPESYTLATFLGDRDSWTTLGDLLHWTHQEGRVALEYQEDQNLYFQAGKEGRFQISQQPVLNQAALVPSDIEKTSDSLVLRYGDWTYRFSLRGGAFSLHLGDQTLLESQGSFLAWKGDRRAFFWEDKGHYYGLGGISSSLNMAGEAHILKGDFFFLSSDPGGHVGFYQPTKGSTFLYMGRGDSLVVGRHKEPLWVEFFPGPTPEAAVAAYRKAIVSPQVPPLWSLGHIVSLTGQETASSLGDALRRKRYPAEAILTPDGSPHGAREDFYLGDWKDFQEYSSPRFFSVSGLLEKKNWGASLAPLLNWGISKGGFAPVSQEDLKLASVSPLALTSASLFAGPKELRLKWPLWTRYQLIPYLYFLYHQEEITGLPPYRPLYWEDPQDSRYYQEESAFLLGKDLFVVPPQGDLKNRSVLFPMGIWFDYYTGRTYQGGREYSLDLAGAKVPLYVRQGSVLPGWEILQWTGETANKKALYTLSPGRGTGYLIEDDGFSLAYRKGGIRRTRIDSQLAGNRWSLEHRVVDMGYGRPRYKAYQIFRFLRPGAPKAVLYKGEPLRILYETFGVIQSDVNIAYMEEGLLHVKITDIESDFTLQVIYP